MKVNRPSPESDQAVPGGVAPMQLRWLGAFTLIELMVALGVVMILIGVGTHIGTIWSADHALHKPMDKLKEFAKRACHLAISEQREWEIVISAHSLELRPKQAASEADQKFLDAADRKQERKPGNEMVIFDSDIRLAVRRFGEDKWQNPRPDYWVFQHSGICEPIFFRVERENRALEVTFDPLTAGAIDEHEPEG